MRGLSELLYRLAIVLGFIVFVGMATYHPHHQPLADKIARVLQTHK